MANAFTHVVLATLGKVASASAQGGLDSGVGSHPVGKRVFAVLDDTVFMKQLARVDLEGILKNQYQTYALLAS